MTTPDTEIELQLCTAVHDADADVEALAHLVAGSDRAQTYLVELIATLSAITPARSAAGAIDRAEALLEHGLAVAAHFLGDPPTGAGGIERAGVLG